MCTQPFDQNIWSFFIYAFFCVRPSDQDLETSLIYFFYLHTTIGPKYMVLLHLFFLLFTTTEPKLRSSLICFFYLYTTIQPNYMVLFHFTKVRCHSYSLIYSFLPFVNISFAIFKAALHSYFVCSVSGSTAFIFCQLYS